MTARIPQALGSTPELPPAFGGAPPHAFHAEWQWLRPLSAILSFSRWTIDDVVSNPRAAAEVRLFWKVYKLARRLAQEREEGSLLGKRRRAPHSA